MRRALLFPFRRWRNLFLLKSRPSFSSAFLTTLLFVSGEKPGPLLYVNEELEFIQDEIFSYYWKRNPQGQNVDEPIDNNDHAMNTLKYMLSKLPEPSEIIIPESVKMPEWMYWQEIQESERV